jgi:hypothetical protein
VGVATACSSRALPLAQVPLSRQALAKPPDVLSRALYWDMDGGAGWLCSWEIESLATGLGSTVGTRGWTLHCEKCEPSQAGFGGQEK